MKQETYSQALDLCQMFLIFILVWNVTDVYMIGEMKQFVKTTKFL